MSNRSIIYPAGGFSETPGKFEFTAAYLLSDFFDADITFIARGSNHTPDFKIKGVVWELKSPFGNGKHTIEHQFSRANKQKLSNGLLSLISRAALQK